jgi:hypothetical protein
MNEQYKCGEQIVVCAEPNQPWLKREMIEQYKCGEQIVVCAEPNQPWLKREINEHDECDEQIERVEANHRWLREMNRQWQCDEIS